MTQFIISNITLETLSHIAGILGLLSIVITAMLAWRKNLLKSGFTQFQDLYRIEMNDFKKTVRDYIAQSDERNTRVLERIAELYEKTHEEITHQNTLCKVIQGKRPLQEKAEKVWKDRIQNQLDKLEKKVDHIDRVVNTKK